MHAADALAVLDANGIGRVSLVTVSRSVNVAVLLVSDDPDRFDRVAAIAPYVLFEADPDWPDREVLEEWRADWRGFMEPFMHDVFTEPDSAVIAEMTALGMEANPDIIATQELELDWQRPAQLLGSVSCPTLVIHGDSDITTPLTMVRTSWRQCHMRGSNSSQTAGTDPTSARLNSSTHCFRPS